MNTTAIQAAIKWITDVRDVSLDDLCLERNTRGDFAGKFIKESVDVLATLQAASAHMLNADIHDSRIAETQSAAPAQGVDAEEMLPCPFCGSSKVNRVTVGCDECDKTEASVGDWNRRARLAQRAASADELRYLVGFEVSMDVSTGEDDAEHRVFGRVNAVMPSAAGGFVLLAEEESRNFAPKASGQCLFCGSTGDHDYSYPHPGAVVAPAGHAEPVAWITKKNLAAIRGKGMAYATGFIVSPDQVALYDHPAPVAAEPAPTVPAQPGIDAYALLAKYMHHVVEVEGVHFICGARPDYLTDSEWAALRTVAEARHPVQEDGADE